MFLSHIIRWFCFLVANHIVLFSSVLVGHVDALFERSNHSDHCSLFSWRRFIEIFSSRTCEYDSLGNRIPENIIQKKQNPLTQWWVYLFNRYLDTWGLSLDNEDWNDSFAIQEKGKIVYNQKKLGRRGFLAYGLQRGHGHTNTLVLDFYSTERSDTCNF